MRWLLVLLAVSACQRWRAEQSPAGVVWSVPGDGDLLHAGADVLVADPFTAVAERRRGADGELLWRTEYGQDPVTYAVWPRATPIGDGDLLVVAEDRESRTFDGVEIPGCAPYWARIAAEDGAVTAAAPLGVVDTGCDGWFSGAVAGGPDGAVARVLTACDVQPDSSRICETQPGILVVHDADGLLRWEAAIDANVEPRALSLGSAGVFVGYVTPGAGSRLGYHIDLRSAADGVVTGSLTIGAMLQETSLTATVDGGVLLGGVAYGRVEAGGVVVESDEDSYVTLLVQVDGDGEVVWVRTFPQSRTHEHRPIVTFDPSGRILVAGGFVGTLHLDEVTLRSVGEADAWVAVVDPADQRVQWAGAFGDRDWNVTTGLAAGTGERIYVTTIGELIAVDP